MGNFQDVGRKGEIESAKQPNIQAKANEHAHTEHVFGIRAWNQNRQATHGNEENVRKNGREGERADAGY